MAYKNHIPAIPIFSAMETYHNVPVESTDKKPIGDEIVNVNFFYDDILHALQYIVRC